MYDITFGTYHMNIVFIISLAAVIIAVIYDLKDGRIPNWVTLPVMTAGVTYHYCSTGLQGLGFSIAGLLIGFSIFLVFHIMGGMGAGDIKLMAALGALLGPRDILFTAAFTAIAGGVYAAVLLLESNNRKSLARYTAWVKGIVMTGHFSQMHDVEQAIPLRYGIAIAAGTITVLLQKVIY
jgi:prepilin peptidase CpaA